jgi:hypothetical protein
VKNLYKMSKNKNILKFKEIVRSDFEDWKNDGACRKALDINKSINLEYFDVARPQYFTGDIQSEIVMVHLNPKRDRSRADFDSKCDYESFDEYWSFCEKFGKFNYGSLSNRSHKSPFDHKQIRFLRPLGLIPFSDNDVYGNLERVVDNKLQLELIPYGSPDFNPRVVSKKIIDPFAGDIIDAISICERKYVLFCGRVFIELLRDFSEVLKEHKFRMLKNNGSLTKNYFEVINILIRYKDRKPIRACILPQFAMQGSPTAQYGKKLAELYFDI